MPAELSIKFDLREGRKGNFVAHKLCSLIICKSDSFSTLDLLVELLANFDEFCLQMVVLLRNVFDAVTFYIWFLYHVAPITANDTEFTSAFMGGKVLLKHLCLTAKESALDCGIRAFIHMSFEVVV